MLLALSSIVILAPRLIQFGVIKIVTKLQTPQAFTSNGISHHSSFSDAHSLQSSGVSSTPFWSEKFKLILHLKTKKEFKNVSTSIQKKPQMDPSITNGMKKPKLRSQEMLRKFLIPSTTAEKSLPMVLFLS